MLPRRPSIDRNLEKRDAASKKQAAQRETLRRNTRNMREDLVEHQAEVETEFQDEQSNSTRRVQTRGGDGRCVGGNRGDEY